MTQATSSARAAALHRRAMDRVAEAAVDEPVSVAGVPSPGAALPGIGVLAVATVGLALGLGATAIAIGRGWDPASVAVGPWMAHPRIGTPAIDPYAQAVLARTGAVPMSAAEGLTFTAATDSTGFRLLRTCFYRLSGGIPAARFWTLAATGPDGLTLENAARRSGFASDTVIRDLAGRFTVEVGPAARPGNWLPLSGEGPLTLTLRLYDTPFTGDPGEIATAALPAIVRLGCGGGAG